ncbi:hypothetical protein SCUCBS95973_008364 [Sporothrix curviconia]|uniref:Uncharacterized protein n=1 Tax=Sporothrix curviconia TaxID=1260050 RepID=A0ABP0CL18_9PEZI
MPYLSYPPITLLGSLSHGDGASLSPFFARLPFDIRRHILIDAFGDHTVHMHLRLEHIPRRRPRREPRSPNIPTIFNTTRPHGGVTADLDHTGLWSNVVLVESDVARGGPHGRRWQWWGYAEGIDVLYGSNTICIMSDRLLNALLRSTPITLLGISPVPQSTLLPPSHLAHITRLELAWEWTLLEDPALAPHQAAQRAVFEDALALLPSAFPNLVSLYVSFSKKLYQRTSIRADACLDEIHQAQSAAAAPLLR